jgi:hypothetical protein
LELFGEKDSVDTNLVGHIEIFWHLLAATEAKLEDNATLSTSQSMHEMVENLWRTCGNHSVKNNIVTQTVSVGISTSIGNDVTSPLPQTSKHSAIQSLQMEEHCSFKLKCSRNWWRHWF